MARSHVADGATVSNMEGSCEYIEQVVADGRQGVFVQLGSWGEMLTAPHRKNLYCYEIFIQKSSDLD